MAGQGRKAIIGALLALLAAPVSLTLVQAQNVPVPAAKPKAGAPAPRQLVPEARAPAPAPITNPFAALLGRPGSTTALDPKQRAIIDRVSNYLSSVQALTGKFVQVGPDGGRSEGTFYIQKPGRIRFEYNPPSPIEVIADGQSVVVRNRTLATQDVYPLSQTPLRFLLADQLNLLKDTNLVAVYADDVFITVVVEEKSGIVGTSRMMLMFSSTDIQLKQWTVTDPQGYDTTVAVYNLDASKRPDPNLFRIDYTSYRN